MGLLRQYLAKLTPALLLGGCSLLYNPSNIGKGPVDGQTIDVEMTADARIDAPPLADANPSMLVLEDVTPSVLFEGQGQGGSRTALLVIRGHHIIDDGLAVSISPSTGLTLGAPQRSNNGDFIALPVTVAIDTNANSGSTPLTITVTQNGGPQGGVALAGKLSLEHLPQFPTGTTIAASSLAPLYSEVNTTSNITITGDSSQPALIHSVSQIKIGNINVSGADASGATLGAGGPGGCPGGDGASTGGCSQNDGGGGGSSGNGGGGGGGFASTGGGGNGTGGGTAGVVHGNAQLVNYSGPDGMKNQSAGGGGGGATTLSSRGAGGGGGGTLELSAAGNIQVGTITANGGKGGDAGTLITGAGGGGGGSGGVVVLRSDVGMVVTGAISATGGGAGAPAGSGGGGGMGASGRVRVDIPIPNAVMPTANPASRRGPSFAANTPTVVTGETNMLTLFGTTDDVVDAYVIDAAGNPHFGEPMNLKFANGALTLTPVLLPGYNRLCVTLRPGTRGNALADKCIDIAYLP